MVGISDCVCVPVSILLRWPAFRTGRGFLLSEKGSQPRKNSLRKIGDKCFRLSCPRSKHSLLILLLPMISVSLERISVFVPPPGPPAQPPEWPLAPSARFFLFVFYNVKKILLASSSSSNLRPKITHSSERFSTQPWCPRTHRLSQILSDVGFSVGGNGFGRNFPIKSPPATRSKRKKKEKQQ